MNRFIHASKRLTFALSIEFNLHFQTHAHMHTPTFCEYEIYTVLIRCVSINDTISDDQYHNG